MFSFKKFLTLGSKNKGEIFFLTGTFFLASALPISYFFYLISFSISFFKRRFNFKDKYNITLLAISVLMVLKIIKLTIIERGYLGEINLQIWLDLCNWLPYFGVFYYSQEYLQTSKQRLLFSKALISGSIPVIISCLLQAWFKIYGPFETLFGLIVWFQKPILVLNAGTTTSGISGLFSNPNYTGIWLVGLVPFIISSIKTALNKSFIINLIFIFSIYCIFLTSSKNALIGLFIILILFFGIKSRQFLISSGILLSLLSFINFIKSNFADFYSNYDNIFRLNIFDKILSFNIFTSSRFEIYKIATQLIFEKPIFGWGKSQFSNSYLLNGGNWKIDHTHSMILEIAFNYGIPIVLCLIGFVIIIFYSSWIKINLYKLNKNSYILDKCWISSGLVIIIGQIPDITYYDGKIATLIWILLAGTRCIGYGKLIKS